MYQNNLQYTTLSSHCIQNVIDRPRTDVPVLVDSLHNKSELNQLTTRLTHSINPPCVRGGDLMSLRTRRVKLTSKMDVTESERSEGDGGY